MICLSCRGVGAPICESCARTVRPVAPGTTPSGLSIQSWALHEAAPSVLVRRLKYEGIVRVAHLIAPQLAVLVPGDARALVPVPRCLTRRVQYGIDAASAIARAVATEAGIPVVHALAPPIWSKQNARASRSQRRAPRFTARLEVADALLIDDVATTGTTLDAAAAPLPDVLGALTATRVH